MADVTIAEAIALYKFSDTAAGVAPAPFAALARRAARKLDELYRTNGVGWAANQFKLNGTDLCGRYWQDRDGEHLQISRRCVLSLPPDVCLAALSLELVHEAGHAAQQPKSTIEEEVEARTLAVYYFRELSGPGVFNEVSDRLYRIQPHALDLLKEQSDFAKDDQLVDWVIDYSRLYRRTLTADWIAAHANDWGRMDNRWAKTRGRYLKVLAQDPDPVSAGLILYILETSGDLPADQQRDDFAQMIAQVDLDDLRQTLTREYARDKDSAARIEALQRRRCVNLVYPGQR